MNEKKMNEAGYWEEKSLKRAEMLKENDGLGVISGRQYRHDSIQMPEIMAETSAALQHLVKKSLKRADAMSEIMGCMSEGSRKLLFFAYIKKGVT